MSLYETHYGSEQTEEKTTKKVAVIPYRYTPDCCLQVLAIFEPQLQYDIEYFLTCITVDSNDCEHVVLSADRGLLEASGINRKLADGGYFMPLGIVFQSKNSKTEYTVMECELPFKDAPSKLVGNLDGSKWGGEAFCSWSSPYQIKDTCHCTVMLSALCKLEHYLEKLKMIPESTIYYKSFKK